MTEAGPLRGDEARRDRRSIRLTRYDYGRPGAYFVTVVAALGGDGRVGKWERPMGDERDRSMIDIAEPHPIIRINAAAADDLPAILALNASNVPHVGSIDAAKLARLHGEAFALRVARVVGDDREGRDDGGGDRDGGIPTPIAGFVLAMVETARYESLNFRWFVARYPRFVYVDRIAVAEGCRGLGIGRRLYANVEALAVHAGRGAGEPVTCEVNIAPPNPGSMAFHDRLGFVGVGERWDEGGATGVRMMVKAVR